MINLDKLLTELPGEAAEAVVTMARLRSRDLARHLRFRLGSPAGTPGSFVSEPFLEGAFPWQIAAGGWEGLSENLLHPEAMRVLKQVAPFPPYAHQVEAWEHLCSDTPKSVIVSSGTGSGKTECFLTPILDRLTRLSDGGRKALTGVRALMLYPLNALIASQEDRLETWFKPFCGNLRYCLYNGETPERARIANKVSEPWKVADRATLRNNPPPVLVTNITMLEYMLIRHRDAPILSNSQGKLDYIVLDEAHSYIGAQAAELSLLLRRVALAFGRRPDEIRYVATSATIGGDDGVELRRFLRDLSGAPEENIHLVRGIRAPLPAAPRLTEALVDRKALSAVSPLQIGAALARSASLRDVRERLRSGSILSWTHWRNEAGKIADTDCNPTELLVNAARARDPYAEEDLAKFGADSILPTRVHVFQRTLTGIWACINSECRGRPEAAVGDWAFGAVYLERCEHCVHCHSLVLEWAFCNRCGDGALKAETVEDGTRIAPWDEPDRDDGFEQTLDRYENYGAEPEEDAASATMPAARVDRRYLAAASTRVVPKLICDRITGVIAEGTETQGIRFDASRDVAHCPFCGFPPEGADVEKGALRAFAAGSPFLMSQVTPAILAHLSPHPTSNEPLPFDGRQLITFTDARQGTARHAANIQVASERAYIRSFLYHLAQERSARDEAKLADLDRKIAKLRASDDPDFLALIPSLEAKRREAEGSTLSRSWKDVIQRLVGEETVSVFAKAIWAEREETFSEPDRLAEFLLYREIMRRPVRANSAETLGLARLIVPSVDVGETILPPAAEKLGINLDDWRDLVRIILTHFIRANVILDFDARRWMRWIDRRQAQIVMQRRRERGAPTPKYTRFWPDPYVPRMTRVVRLVVQGLGIDREDRSAQDDLEELFEAAWSKLLPYMTSFTEGYRFRLSELHIAPVERAYLCPTTRRIVDTTFRGLSPYDENGIHPKALPLEMPKFPFSWGREASGERAEKAAIRDWLVGDPNVQVLRDLGVWGDQQDRAAQFARWYRTAEHSAQQPSFLLRQYEGEFKAQKINVMSCSTTMEMGVDIGSVEAVLNTNAPPAIANYRQRVGRAGRARQPIALAVTLCKDKPLDQFAFADPGAFLVREVPAPRVSLESPTIARRHANAYLLAGFLSKQGAELHKLTNSRFFGLGLDPGLAGTLGFPWKRFTAWVDIASTDQSVLTALGTVLAGTPVRVGRDLFEDVRDAIESIQVDLAAEWEALNAAATGDENEGGAANKARDFQRRRLEQNYLLGELAGRGFLPSYGFPTNVVPFITETAEERKRREDEAEEKDEDANRFKARGWPSRQRDIAIYEYAPGRGIVVDGVVRESEGVTLNWKRPADEAGVREVQNLRQVRWCRSCGALTSTPASVLPGPCEDCGDSEFRAVRFLAPAGFAVDIRYEVHDDTRDLGGSPPVDPWVAARTPAWRALPDPTVGRVRTGPDGMVFWFNPGPKGHGFEICLHCGRSSPESSPGAPSNLAGHRPLRGQPRAEDDITCTGGVANDAPFAIARNLSLGQEIRTDVCEVQLYECRSRPAALTIALALRETAARRLGVDADEMGFAAPEAAHASLGRSYSAVVFDRASGGAGFSTTIAHDPVGFLHEARGLLDCTRSGRCGDPDRTFACPRCVLSADSQHSIEDTDRKAAYSILSNAISQLTLPDDAKLFGASTAYEPAPLRDATSERLVYEGSADLLVPMTGIPSEWDFESWPMTPVLERWGARGRTPKILLDANALADADLVTRHRFVLWAQRARVAVHDIGASRIPFWLAAVAGSESTTAWASAGSNVRDIGIGWAAASEAPLVRGSIECPILGPVVEFAPLLSSGAKEALLEIEKELDGPATGFGARLRAKLEAASPEVKRVLSAKFVSLTYSDRYLFNPVSVRLVTELMAGLADVDTDLTITTLSKRRERPKSGRWIYTDWPDMSIRSQVLSQMLSDVTPRAVVDARNEVSHCRKLDFVTALGAGTIYFDQGVGAWSSSQPMEFDHLSPLDVQIEHLRKPFLIANRQDRTFVAIRLT